MIQQITTLQADTIAFLEENWRGRRILAYYDAYGGTYDFCRFYKLSYETGTGWLLLFNSTLLICTQGEIPKEELIDFVKLYLPFRIECPAYIVEYLSEIENYQKLHRDTFRLIPNAPSENFQEEDVCFTPDYRDVYEILQEGFPNLADYPMWLTDISHRVRHGVSQVLTYKNSTTLTLIFDRNDKVLVGQVATKAECRGSGYARDFLWWLAGWLNSRGKEAVLSALDIRISFYKEIGFEEILSEYVLERRDIEKEQQEKGAL